MNELQRRNPSAKVIVRAEGVANSAIGPEKALASARTHSPRSDLLRLRLKHVSALHPNAAAIRRPGA